MPTIKPGLYLISNVDHDSFLGTGLIPISTHPKPIVRLPGGVRAPVWEVVRTDNGYLIKIFTEEKESLPVSPMDGSLWAFSEEPPRPQLWEIKNSERDGPNIFVVSRMNGFEGWVLDEEEPYSQVKVRPLIVGPSFPPFYPARQLFRFTPYPDDE